MRTWRRVESPPAPLQIVPNTYSACGIKMDDTLSCWGQHQQYEGFPEHTKIKQLVAGGTGHKGWWCAIKMNGSLVCWGQENGGTLNAR